MPNPPFPFQPVIDFGTVKPGITAQSQGGGSPTARGEVNAVIIGDTAGVFAISGIEVDALVHDPDAPPGSPRVWEEVAEVDGSGPITIARGNAVGVTAT